MTYTKGPWTISGSSIWNTETRRAIYASGCKPINERDEEGQANAHLIAAAPDLLEALECMLRGYGGTLARLDAIAQAAINKARGE